MIQDQCRLALLVFLLSVVCELAITAVTIVTLVSSGDSTTSNILFLCVSLLTTAVTTTVNLMGTKRLVQAVRASARRVHQGRIAPRSPDGAQTGRAAQGSGAGRKKQARSSGGGSGCEGSHLSPRGTGAGEGAGAQRRSRVLWAAVPGEPPSDSERSGMSEAQTDPERLGTCEGAAAGPAALDVSEAANGPDGADVRLSSGRCQVVTFPQLRAGGDGDNSTLA